MRITVLAPLVVISSAWTGVSCTGVGDGTDGITWEPWPTVGRTRFGCKNGMGWEDTCEAPCQCRILCEQEEQCNFYAGTKKSGCFFFEICDEMSETPNYSQKLQTQHKVCPEPECGDITDPCECTGDCGWSSTNDECVSSEESTTDCMECPTMDGCDASNCVPAEKCGMFDPMRVCQCNPECEEHDNCCPDVDQCGTDESCNAITKHKDCKPAPGCHWQFDDKECLSFAQFVEKINNRPCDENGSKFQCDQNESCGYYFKEDMCMKKNQIPCDNAKTKANCNKRFPGRPPKGGVRCEWDGEACMTVTFPKACEDIRFMSPCINQGFRGCVWDGSSCSTAN